MKIIRTCKDCGFFRYTDPTDYHFKGAAICSYRSKKLQSPYEIPEWCHLEAVSTPTIPEWINTQHMHCKKCGKIIECAGRIEWDVDVGVRAYGICGKCGLMLIQYEKQAKDKWIKI